MPCNLSKRPREDVNVSFHLRAALLTATTTQMQKQTYISIFVPLETGDRVTKHFLRDACSACDIVTYFTSSASHWSQRAGLLSQFSLKEIYCKMCFTFGVFYFWKLPPTFIHWDIQGWPFESFRQTYCQCNNYEKGMFDDRIFGMCSRRHILS